MSRSNKTRGRAKISDWARWCSECEDMTQHNIKRGILRCLRCRKHLKRQPKQA